MSAGALTFDLKMEGGQFAGAANKGVAQINAITAAAETSSASLSRLTQLQSGLFVKMDAGILASRAAQQLREGTYVAIQGTQAAAHAVSTSSAKGVLALKQLNQALLLIGLQSAPQATIAIQTAAMGMSSVKSAAAAVGLGLGPTAAILLGIAAAAATFNEGLKAVKAELEEQETFKRLQDQREGVGERNLDTAERLSRMGYLSGRDYSSIQNIWTNRSAAAPTETNDRIRALLKPALDRERQSQAAAQFDEQLAKFADELLPDAEKAKVKIQREIDEMVGPLAALARAGGRDEQEVFALAQQLRAKRISEIKTESPARTPAQRLPVTDLERMGAVFRYGPGGSMDYQRQIAKATQSSEQLLKSIDSKVGNNSTSNIN